MSELLSGVHAKEVVLMFAYPDGDMATVTVSGYEQGLTALKALAQAGNEEVIRMLFHNFTELGDTSMLGVFDEVGNE